MILVVLGLGSCVDFNDKDNEPVNGFEPAQSVLISELHAEYAQSGGSDVKIEKDVSIAGIVTMTSSEDNLYYKQAFIQDESGAIAVMFNGSSSILNAGNELTINLKDMVLSEYAGLLQLTDNPFYENNEVSGYSGLDIVTGEEKWHVSAENKGTAHLIKVISIDEFNAKAFELQGQLIAIEDVQFKFPDDTWADPEKTNGDNRTIADCSGNETIVRTRGSSTFATEKVPTGKGRIVGCVGIFNSTAQLYVRHPDELDMENERCGEEGIVFKEDFNAVVAGEPIAFTSWMNAMESGNTDVLWVGDVFYDDKSAAVSAYQSGVEDIRSWLISPEIDMSGAQSMIASFDSKFGHDNGAELKVMISENFNGTNITDATWTEFDYAKPDAPTSGNFSQWKNSGEIDISAYSGKKINIGFLYVASDGSVASTTKFQIKNLLVK
ncbi:hypothetical protein AUTU_47160 (plasmid) [Aureibacter tunicatorum]|nr:hypothetical protein AUTU_47160 [Aureibacter tunicatorum]